MFRSGQSELPLAHDVAQSLILLLDSFANRFAQTVRTKTVSVCTSNYADVWEFSTPARQIFASICSFPRRSAMKVFAAV